MDFFELLSYGNSISQLIPVEMDPFTTLLVSMVIAGCLFVVLFALQAVALYTIAKREGYRHKWMAFIPFFNTYYIGVVSDKNKFYNFPAKTVSLVLAIIETLLVAGFVLYYVVAGIVYAGGFYEVVTQTTSLGITYIVGYQSSARIAGTWLAWVFDYLDAYVLSYVNLVYILIHVVVVITFFQTYSCRRYVLLSLACVIFPIKGALMFAVRNNRAMSYKDYMRGEQRRRYENYRQYNNQSGTPYGGYNPYSGRPSAPPDEGASAPPQGEDPFGGLGKTDGDSSAPEDPFDEFKN